MKMLARFKSASLAVLFFITIIVLAQETSKDAEDPPPDLAFTLSKHFRTTEKKKIEEKRCTDFGKEVMEKLKADEEIRDAFFEDLSEFLARGFKMEIIDMVISEDDKVCIQYIRHVEPKQPKPKELSSKTRLV